MSELPKGFQHREVDPKWYAFWDRLGAFRADPTSSKPPFSMVIPPPNVTGSLHIGHALNQTLPDIIIRWKRMQGFDVLWLPGTDHAGIATQNVVEKQLAQEGRTRHDLGREAFEERIWEWVKQSHSVITGQMRKLGSSVDWSRERFTLDDNLSRAVRRVFVTLYNEGLIYRDKYIVSWCPRCRTALSDLEVIHHDSHGKLYYIRYPLLGDGGTVSVATTRPETMLGDTAIAVNPTDDRYRHLVGRRARLPVIDRELPIISDDFVNPEFGTGVVKVTPAHDPNDFQIGRRHGLPQVSVIDEDGRMTAAAGSYAGLDRFDARAKLVEQLEREDLLEKVVDHSYKLGRCERCNTVAEPLVSTQWFVSVEPLAREAIRAVEDGRITIVPENWKTTYLNWMNNIHDWCISRQLWWGHRIPAWYCRACSQVIVSEDTPERCSCGGSLVQETDVLDTWFSSGLWPFSTMGWPEDTIELRRYYPTSLLITGFDIIFFWVARMIMLGLKFTGQVPFEQVYITSLVRDAQGQKMSKSKGNIINPLEVMEEVGADAFRFTLAILASPGMDISLSEGRLRGYREFINKIWNVARFVLMNSQDVIERPAVPDPQHLGLIHRWILHRVSVLAGEVNDALQEYRFDVASRLLYDFCWHEYADWYVELVKLELQANGQRRAEAQGVLLELHDRVLRMLHPFIPFVTEELWQRLPRLPEDSETITLAAFPTRQPSWIDDRAQRSMQLLQEVITAIRAARAELGIPPSQRIRLQIEGADARARQTIDGHLESVKRLAALEDVEFAATVTPEPDTIRRVVGDLQLQIPLTGVDREAEKSRIRKELNNVEKEKTGLATQLANPMFVERAAEEVVSEKRIRQQHLNLRQQKLERNLQELGG